MTLKETNLLIAIIQQIEYWRNLGYNMALYLEFYGKRPNFNFTAKETQTMNINLELEKE